MSNPINDYLTAGDLMKVGTDMVEKAAPETESAGMGISLKDITEFAKAFSEIAKAASELVQTLRPGDGGGGSGNEKRAEVGGERSFNKVPKAQKQDGGDFVSQALSLLEEVRKNAGDVPISSLIGILKGEVEDGDGDSDRGEDSGNLRTKGKWEDYFKQGDIEDSTEPPDCRSSEGVSDEGVSSLQTSDDELS